jgi:hypothetical protein
VGPLASLESQLAACVPLVTVRNFLIFEAERTEVTTGYELLRPQDAAQSEPCCLVLEEQQEDLGKCNNPYQLVTRSVSLWKQWEVQEEGIVAQDVGWRDPGNAPQVGTEPGGKLRGACAWCWLTRVGRSHQEDAYLVQQYGEANGNRKCLRVLTRTGADPDDTACDKCEKRDGVFRECRSISYVLRGCEYSRCP